MVYHTIPVMYFLISLKAYSTMAVPVMARKIVKDSKPSVIHVQSYICHIYIIHNYIIHMCIYNCCWVHEVTIKNIAYIYIIILYIIYI